MDQYASLMVLLITLANMDVNAPKALLCRVPAVAWELAGDPPRTEYNLDEAALDATAVSPPRPCVQ